MTAIFGPKLELLLYPAIFEIWKWHGELKPALAGRSLPTPQS